MFDIEGGYIVPDTHGMVWWTELMTRDVDAAVRYYGDICGWTFETVSMMDGSGTYHIAMKGDQRLAGIMDMSSMTHLEGVPAHWFSYFAVEDIDAAIVTTKSAGGLVLRDPFDVPDTGRIVILQDPTGAAMGMIVPATSN